MKVELRLYPNINLQENHFLGMFDSLPDAWHHAEYLTTISDYTLRDFFTLEHKDEVSNSV
jgi:hypothetical protein